MHAASFGSDLRITSSIKRIKPVQTHRNRIRPGTSQVQKQFVSLPGRQAILKLFRKALRVASGPKRFPCQDAGRLVISMAVPAGTTKTRNNDIRTEFADHTHEISQNLFPSPFFQSFVSAFGKAEVIRLGKELFRSIEPPRRQQFLGPQQSQRLILLVSQQILPAISTSSGKVGGAKMKAPRQVRQQLAVFIVRVGGNQKNRPDHRQPVDRFGYRRRIGSFRGKRRRLISVKPQGPK